MKDTDTGDLALIAAFVLLPLLMVNALFMFIISLLGGQVVYYLILLSLDAAVLGGILYRTEVGQVVRSYFN